MNFASLLRSASLALYGRESAPDLARDLGVNERTVRRWMAGSHEPGSKRDVLDDVLGIAANRHGELIELIKALQKRLMART